MKKEILPCEPGNSPLVVDTGEQASQTDVPCTDTGSRWRGYPPPLSTPLHSTPGKNSSGGEGRLLFRPLVMSDARRSRVGRESGVGNGQIGRFRGRAAAMLFLPWSKEKNERERESLCDSP